MGLYKIHFVTCFTLLSFQIRGTHSRSFIDEEKLQEITNHIEDSYHSSVAQKCLCFPYINSGIPIKNYLTPDAADGGQERLVVYFYKTRNSGKLTIFMPSQQKQLLFPDLTYDEGDRLETIVPEQLIDLFHNDMGYLIKIPQEIESTNTDKEFIIPSNNTFGTDLENLDVPINNNEENNENILFPENAIQYPLSELVTTENVSGSNISPYIHENVLPSNNNKIMNLALGNDQWYIKNTNTEASQNSNQPLDGENKQLQPTYNMPDNNLNAFLSPKETDNGDQTIPMTSNIDLFGTQYNNLPHGNVEHIGSQHIPVDYKDFNVYPKETGPGLGGLTKPQVRPKIPSHISPDNHSNFYPPLGSQNQAINNIAIAPEKEYMPAYQAQNSLQSTIKYNFPKYTGPLPSYTLVDKNPNWSDVSYPNTGNDINSIRYLASKYEHPIFDNWFIKQIKILSLKRPSISKVDLRSLKVLLMNALRENGIYMSENGELYDLYGNVYKMSNIKLHPILLGNPIDYEKLVASNSCVIPHDIPYLEAVLVSFGNPPKILAIIPLKRFLVTKSHDSVPLDHNNIQFGNTRCGSHECTQSKLSEEPATQFSDQIHNENYDEISGLTEDRSDDSEKENNVLETSHNGNKDSSLDISLKHNYQNLLPPLLPSFRSMYGEDIANLLEDKDLKGKTVEDFDVPHTTSNKPDDEDSLGIRIIGGNPATSSGTPVSSKGRSGLSMSIL